MNLEKNDVNIKPMFAWGKEFNLLNNKDEVIATLYMRLVGDADLNRARIYALRKSAEKRKALRDSDSDDHLAFIQERGTVDKERLVALCSLLVSKDLAKQAVKEVTIPQPKEPKADAKTEAFEIYQKEIDEYPAKLDVALREYITRQVDNLTKYYNEKSEDELYDLYVEYFVDQLCDAEMLSAFKEMCTYYGTFKDPNYKERFFESFLEFTNLPEDVKSQFIGAYDSLEVTPDELKKLQVATQ